MDCVFKIEYPLANSIGHTDDVSRLINAHHKSPGNSLVAAVSPEPEVVSVLTTN